MYVSLITAVDENNGIGFKGKLPWKLPEDMAFFRKMTMEHVVLMGRKTFESIGQPLPLRVNLILTRDETYTIPRTLTHTFVVNSFEEAIEITKTVNRQDLFVIGGSEIYQLALPHANRILLTRIHKAFECDSFFPTFDKADWHESIRDTFQSEINQCSVDLITYQRVFKK